jgi:ABC-type phosphate/phosphonate transport system substrate-binding protein
MTKPRRERPRCASLSMYDGGELASANDALWDAIARRLRAFGVGDVPRALDRECPLEALWSSGQLLFGQVCGYPFAARFRDQLRVLAAPHYAVPGCARGRHRSYVVVHARSAVKELAALRGTRAAINDTESMTGRHLLGDAVYGSSGARPFFAGVVISGSHARSLAMVAAGTADVAAIDCVSYAHLARAAPEIIRETRVLHRTITTPTLPFVISTECGEVAAYLVARALADVFDDPRTRDARAVLRLVGIDQVRADVYSPTLAVAARADHVFGGRPRRFQRERLRGGGRRGFESRRAGAT